MDWLGVALLIGNSRPKLINEEYFLVRKMGLGKWVVGLSLVVTEVSRGGGIRCHCATY